MIERYTLPEMGSIWSEQNKFPTWLEFEILALLARRKGSAVTRDALVDAALDPALDGSRRTLDVHISRLRSKLGTDAAQLETVWGIGYRLSEGR